LFTVKWGAAFAQAPAITYSSPQTYPLNAPIAPLAPTNTGGAVPVGAYGQVTTIAGNGHQGFKDANGKAAIFYSPEGLALDKSGNLYVSDTYNNRIRKIAPGGMVTTFAGSGLQGSADGGSTFASFNVPIGLAMDATGDLYVADSGNHTIRMVTPSGFVSTFAGSGNIGRNDGMGIFASFNGPYGIAIDAANNLYVTDAGNNEVRMITPTGYVSTLAGGVGGTYVNGPGTLARFDGILGIAIDKAGNLYVDDEGNLCIREITPSGVVSTFAGNGATGPLSTLLIEDGPALDNSGNVYLTDMFNNQIDEITTAGVFSIIAGSGKIGSADGLGKAASFSGPQSALADNAGNLYITDAGNNLIRKITLTGYSINKPLPPGLTFDSTTGIIGGTPTAASPPTDYTVTATNASGISSTIVNIQTGLSGTLLPSIITFPPPILVLDANDDYNPHATSTNTETPIIYTSSDPSVATVDSYGLLHVIAPGVTTITATQSGDANYSPAVPVTEILYVTETQVIQFLTFSPVNTCDSDFPVEAASSNPTIPLTYSSSNPAVATISADGTIHIVGVGTTTITIYQGGNSLYTPAPPQSQLLTVTSPVPPIITIAYNNSSGICAGTPVTFKATVTNGNADILYAWQVNGEYMFGNTSSITLPSLKTTDIVQCTATNNGPCPVSATSNTITGVNILPYTTPSIVIQSSAAVPVCSSTLITFTATPTDGGANPAYQWQVNGANAGTNSATFASNTLNDGDVITCLLTNNGGQCLTASQVVSNTIKVGIIPTPTLVPTVTITPDGYGACVGMSLTYTATTTNAGSTPTYQWQVNGQDAGTNAATFTSSTLNTGDKITCTITSSLNCSVATATSNTASLTADAYTTNSVIITSTAVNNIISPNQPVTFTAKTAYTTSGTTTVAYQWQVNNVNAGINSPFFTTNSLKNDDVITCIITTTGKCIASPVVFSNPIEILVITPVIIFNTFTPNGDGVNDTWDIPSLAAYTGCTVNIFNRYGLLVYNSVGYPKSWDGTFEGKPLPSGTYYYVIDLKNGKKTTIRPCYNFKVIIL